MVERPQSKLVFLRGPSKLDARQNTLPTRLKILNWGRNESTEGAVLLDELSASLFVSNQSQIGRTRCPLDFEHNTVPGTEEYNRTQEPRKIAAFGAPKIIPGDGLYLETLDWKVTAETAKNFEDLSAAPMLDANHRVIALHSAALTKAGAVYNLPSFFEQAQLSALLTGKVQLRGMAKAMAAHCLETGEDFNIKQLTASGVINSGDIKLL